MIHDVRDAETSGSPHTDPIASSRQVVGLLLASIVAVTAAFATLAPVVLVGDDALFAFPVLVHGALICAAIVCMLTMCTGLRVDSFMLFVAWETLRGCVAPVILMYVGPGTRFYYRLGTPSDSRTVLFIGSLFFAAVLATRVIVALFEQRRNSARRVAPDLSGSAFSSDRMTAGPLVLVGLVGLALRFPTPGAIQAFFSGSVEGLQGNGEFTGGPLLLAANFLRPLLVIGLVMLIRTRRTQGLRWWPLVPVTVVAVVLALASYGLNRGTVAYCLIAIALVYFERSRRRLRLGTVVVVLGALGAFFALVGQLRSTIWAARTGLGGTGLDPVSVLQSVLPYAATPAQLSAAMPVVAQSNPFGWHTFVMSLLSPVPGAPEAARTESGTALFNNIVYHSFVGKDQLLPTWFEGWLSFGLLGTIGVGVVVGVLLSLADALRRSVHTQVGLYGATIFALWVPQAGVTTISVIEQNTIYFALTPLVVAALARVWPTGQNEHRLPTRPRSGPRKATR